MSSVADRLRLTLEMQRFGLRMLAQRVRRGDPTASDDAVRASVQRELEQGEWWDPQVWRERPAQ